MTEKRIADPVHGTIELSTAEIAIISSRAFQRLRHVKQLGLAHLVFPGADYSRFSHCLGVCHVTSQILQALQQNAGKSLDDEEVRLYRLAALLHDIGHYPFSHAAERAVENYYKSAMTESLSEPDRGGDPTLEATSNPLEPIEPRYFSHERVGKEVLTHDSELDELFKRHRVDPVQVANTFLRQNPPPFANLISSDLDADRIDYLMRTALHTGLPYGNVDFAYLLSQMRVDSQDRISLTQKALRTAEHFLLARHFDYQQVSFHKTVAAMEWLLEDTLFSLLEHRYVELSAEDIRRMIEDGTWSQLDDGRVMERIRDLATSAENDDVARLKAQSLLTRTVPKLVWSDEYFGERGQGNDMRLRLHVQVLKSNLEEWVSKYGISRQRWHIWGPRSMSLTKIGSYVPYSAAMEGDADSDRYEQSIRIQQPDGSSRPIAELEESLMSSLANQALYAMRFYVLLEDPSPLQSIKDDVTAAIKSA